MLSSDGDPKTAPSAAGDVTATHAGAFIPSETADFPAVHTPFTDLVAHAHGGLGDVFRATDPELNRTVALKRLQARHAGKPGTHRRFLVEAEVTARLEHPGVVPVYGLYSGERPAYAMRFVEGQTLAQAVTAYYAGPPHPVAFRRLIQAFLQVCQTVAYAHNRGVIHRDLKPANVMLGQFGEALVLDWGLAKVVGRPDDVRETGVGETLVPSAHPGDSSETAMGSAMGTPAYMSPEQAAGRWDVIDHRSDVYGLGAVLYTILIGRPPLEKGNWPEMQQKIQRGDFPRPREVRPDVPRPLEAICLKAMAPDPSARYPSAEALAADVDHWMADEATAVYREPFLARSLRWARRHRTLVSAAAVSLVVAVVGLAAGAALLGRKNNEIERERQTAVTARRKAEAINRFLIQDLLKQADPVNNPVGAEMSVRQLLDKASARLDAESNLADQPEVEIEVRTVIGHAYEYLGLAEKAGPHYSRAYDLRVGVLGPDHPETLEAFNRVVWAVVNQEDLARGEPMAVEAFNRCLAALGDENAETAVAANNLAEVRVQQKRFEDAVALRKRASHMAHAAVGPDDNRTLEIDTDLGVALVRVGRPAEAEPLVQSVVDRRRRLTPNHPELATSLGNLGGILLARNEFPRARAVLSEAVETGTRIGGREHATTLANENLYCYALEGLEQWAEAEKLYMRVLKDRQRLAGQGDHTLSGVHKTLAAMARFYAKQERWPDAARSLATLILSLHPDPSRKPDALADAIAAALAGKRDLRAAEPVLRECREAVDTVLWPGDWMRAELASRYGDCLRRQGESRFVEAEQVLLLAAKDVQSAVGVPAWGIPAARQRVAALYADWNRPDEAARWK